VRCSDDSGIFKYGHDDNTNDNGFSFNFIRDNNRKVEMMTITENSVGVGEFHSYKPARAPVHIRTSAFATKTSSTPNDVGMIIEGKSNSLILSGEQSGGIQAVNNVILSSTPVAGGFSEFWVVSQRGPNDNKFAGNSLAIFNTDQPSNINNDNLNELKGIDVPTLTLTSESNVCIGCNGKNRKSRVSVNGEVDAAEINLYADHELLKSKTLIKGGKALDMVNRVNAYECSFIGINSKNIGRGVGGGGATEFCIVANDVQTVDGKLVTTDSEGVRSIRLRGLLTVLWAATKDLDKKIENYEDDALEVVKRLEKLESHDSKSVAITDKSVKRLDELEANEKTMKDKIIASQRTDIDKLKQTVEVLVAEKAKDAELIEVYKRQVEGIVKSFNLLSERIEAGINNNKNNNDSDDNNSNSNNSDDMDFFLGEVTRLEREFLERSETKVTDSQLEGLRNKWRTQAHVALGRRKADREFLKGRT